ncbi:hypothetical protein AFK68_26430 [Hydrocoleum sp. CS-953]|nr:hypothetical protein AFK68_26430 [Hydrocoleum sp. CS-953]
MRCEKKTVGVWSSRGLETKPLQSNITNSHKSQLEKKTVGVWSSRGLETKPLQSNITNSHKSQLIAIVKIFVNMKWLEKEEKIINLINTIF